MGNASWGSQRIELPPGDYRAQILGVRLGEREDYNDKTKLVPAFAWEIAILQATGAWENQTVNTSRTITDMSRLTNPNMISGLNRLIYACGLPVPQTAETVAAWNEQGLVGREFIWRVEVDGVTGKSVRRWLPLAPPPAPAARPPAPTPRPPAPTPRPPGTGAATPDPFAGE